MFSSLRRYGLSAAEELRLSYVSSRAKLVEEPVRQSARTRHNRGTEGQASSDKMREGVVVADKAKTYTGQPSGYWGREMGARQGSATYLDNQHPGTVHGRQIGAQHSRKRPVQAATRLRHDADTSNREGNGGTHAK
jgi:hypothetical protein